MKILSSKTNSKGTASKELQILVSCSDDGTIQVFNVDPQYFLSTTNKREGGLSNKQEAYEASIFPKEENKNLDFLEENLLTDQKGEEEESKVPVQTRSKRQ